MSSKRDRFAQPSSLAEIVRHYKAVFDEPNAEQIQLFQSQKSLRAAVRLAGLAQTPSGKRFSHQWRLRPSTLLHAEAALQRRLSDLRRAATFHELWECVQSAIGDIRGVGELTVYDTAIRIGAFLRLEPERVYLHAGTREGARSLSLGAGREWLEIRELPVQFRQLKGRRLEDVLCIYKRELKSLMRGLQPNKALQQTPQTRKVGRRSRFASGGLC